MEELLALERKLKKEIANEENILREKGYTKNDLQILEQAVECIAYPILKEHFSVFYKDMSDSN